MRFIHLADLHIGKTVNGFSMLDDQAYALEQILKYVEEYSPQAVVISGDVYDKPTPGTDAVKVFDQFLTDLVKGQTAVFIISGNHDSPERLSFAGRIIQAQNVYLCGVFDGRMQTVTLDDEFGQVCFYLLPFIKPVTVKRYFDENTISSYHDAVKAVICSADIDREKRNVLVAHQFFVSAGSEPELSESEIGPVGGIDSIDVGLIFAFDYIALGHLHGRQPVGYERVQYSGSLLKYSFSECHHQKSVTLVELREKENISIVPLPITPLHEMRKIKGPIAELLNGTVISQGNNEDYLHVTLTDDDEVMDAIGKIRAVYPNVMTLAFENRRTEPISDFSDLAPVEQVSPLALFKRFFFAQNGIEMKPEQEAIAEELLAQAGGEA